MPGTFLDELDEPARIALRRRGIRRTWQPGSAVFHEGDRADRVVIIESGIVKAVVASEAGIDTVLALRGPGDILGELSAVGGGTRSASVIAMEPVTALVIPLQAFREHLAEHPDAALAVLGILSDRLRDAGRRQAEYGTLDTRLRLARLLVDLAEAYGQSTEAGLRVRLLSQEELASFCSASREAVARALRALREEGLIETGRRSLTIVDLDRLRSWTPS